MIKAVIFDLDGTLVDSEKYNFHAWKEFLNNHGQDLDLEKYSQNFVGQSKEYIAQKCEELVKIKSEEIIKEKDEIYERLLIEDPVKPMYFAEEILKELRNYKVLIACATGSSSDEAYSKLEHLDLKKYFDAIVTKDDVKTSKPDPETYQLAMKKLGVTAIECFAVEDTVAGYQSASAAGIKTFIVKHDINQFLEFPTTDIFENLEKVWSYIVDAI